jgi:hypothetical protein
MTGLCRCDVTWNDLVFWFASIDEIREYKCCIFVSSSVNKVFEIRTDIDSRESISATRVKLPTVRSSFLFALSSVHFEQCRLYICLETKCICIVFNIIVSLSVSWYFLAFLRIICTEFLPESYPLEVSARVTSSGLSSTIQRLLGAIGTFLLKTFERNTLLDSDTWWVFGIFWYSPLVAARFHDHSKWSSISVDKL